MVVAAHDVGEDGVAFAWAFGHDGRLELSMACHEQVRPALPSTMLGSLVAQHVLAQDVVRVVEHVHQQAELVDDGVGAVGGTVVDGSARGERQAMRGTPDAAAQSRSDMKKRPSV